MTTKEVIDNFIEGAESGKASGGRLYITDDKLINYSTTIAQRVKGAIIVNMTKYSPTTSRHQNRVKSKVENALVVNDVPEGAYDISKYLK